MNNFLQEFKDRGLFYQCTNENGLNNILNKGKIFAYIGFDSTATSLHVGSLIQIMCLKLLQKHGHQPIILLGGGTTRIGDPSGKEETRKILSDKQIEFNIKNIKKVFKIYLKNKDKKLKPIFVNNFKWLGKLKYINFLRDIGRHFTLNKMLSFDSVKLRLDREQSLSYMEFNYMILQAYDFLELKKNKDCVLQIGGSDQWGNIVNGVELIKRQLGKEVFGLTTPLLTLANGAKMGKTEKGAVWLDSKLLSAYDYWQFWRNTDDRDVIKFLKMFTDISTDKIDSMKNENINDLKIILANEATKLLHGDKETKKVERASKALFVEGSLSENLPTFKIEKSKIKDGINILDAIIITKLVNSKSEIRRVIKNKGIKVNDQILESDKLELNRNFFNDNICKISFGKKKHAILKID